VARETERKSVSRRRFMILSAGATGALLAACAAPPAPTPSPLAAKPAEPKPAEAKPAAADAAKPAAAATKPAAAEPAKPAAAATVPAKMQEQPAAATAPGKYKESPMLADLVKQGKLPAVEQRLPPQPLVVKPTKMVGKYGGTLRGAGLAPETTYDLQVAMVAGLFHFSHDLAKAEPEVATGYEFSSDSKVCTISLRKGIKWSDGKPFTADDVIFFFDDIQFNKDLFPTVPGQYRVGGQPIKVTKVDEATVKFEFAVPNPAFSLIHYSGAPAAPWRPRHYLEKFHAQYTPNAEAESKAQGFNNWQARFAKLAGTGNSGFNYGAQNPDMPVLEPWRPVTNTSQGQEFERNPYYFKVDTDGNQLPYVDKMVVEWVSNTEVMNLKATSGQLSVAGMDLLLQSFPVLKQGEAQGAYKVHLAYSERGADVALALNQNHSDPVVKKLFGDVRFRQALSVGINRGEINELVFLGQGTPRQATVNESASFYKKEWGEHFAQYDEKLANKLLDEVGLDKKGSDGIRLRSDGKPMAFQLEYLPHEGPKKEVCELVVKHWSKLGLKVEAAGRERSFLITRLDAGQQDVSGWHVDRELERAAYTYGSSGSKLGPGGGSAIQYAKAWRDWFNSGGKTGVEPPQDAKMLQAAFEKWQTTTMGTPEYTKAAVDVHELIKETLYVIGVVGQGPQPIIVKNNLENVIDPNVKRQWWGAANWFWRPTRSEQWFFTS
jgi:peptide/nickel transport system substrate-binding protein